MNDEERAALGDFKVSAEDLIALIDEYKKRKYVDDITYIDEKLKGMDSLLDALCVDPARGIDTKTIMDREKVFGTNRKDPPTRTPFWELLFGALDDIMLKILMVCAVVSMVVDGLTHKPGGAPWYVEGLAIWMAVAVVSIVTAVSDYKKEGEFLKKQQIEENAKIVTYLRDGKEITEHKNNIKVGEIVKIINGMNIPVDGIVISGIGVLSDESAMTGESDHLQKECVEKCKQRQQEFENDNPDMKAD
jgi:magnesium-transporting ATPase (P-type)